MLKCVGIISTLLQGELRAKRSIQINLGAVLILALIIRLSVVVIITSFDQQIIFFVWYVITDWKDLLCMFPPEQFTTTTGMTEGKNDSKLQKQLYCSCLFYDGDSAVAAFVY